MASTSISCPASIADTPLTQGLTAVFYDYGTKLWNGFATFENEEPRGQFCGQFSFLHFPDNAPQIRDLPHQRIKFLLDLLATGSDASCELEALGVDWYNYGMGDFPFPLDLDDSGSLYTQRNSMALKLCGEIEIPEGTGNVDFYIEHDDGVILYIDNEVVIKRDALNNRNISFGTFTKGPGKYKIKLVLFDSPNEMNLAFYWDLTAKMSGLTPPNPVLQSDETGLQFILVGKDANDVFVDNFKPLLDDPEYPIALVPSESLFPVEANDDEIPSICRSPFLPSRTFCGGDPHFLRWGSESRDSFHGECDLVLLSSKDFHGIGLDIHIRTTIADYYSYIESAAVKIGHNVLEFEKDKVLLGGKPLEHSEFPISFGDKNGYMIDIAVQTKSRTTYSLKLDHGVEIFFKFYKNFLNVETVGHDDLVDSKGLLGSYPAGDMIGRDGSLFNNYIDFAFDYQVSPEDPRIFSTLREPQLPYERCRLPSSGRPSRRNLRAQKNKLLTEAQEACAGQTESNFDLCVDDVMMTGDIGIAEDW